VCLVRAARRSHELVSSLNATVVKGHSVLLHCGSSSLASGHVVKWFRNGDVRSLSDTPRFQVRV